MLNQKFIKTTAIIFLLLIAIVFLGLYAYNISQQQELSTPKKVYRAPTESEMKIVEQNIKNAKQRQQQRSNQQNLASESHERSDDVDPKSNEDLSKSQVSIKESLDNPIIPTIEELVENGSLKIIEHVGVNKGERITAFDDLKPKKGNATFETKSIEELQNYISKLENSDNPKHRKVAQEFRNLLSQMNPPENAIFSISVED